MKVSEIYNDISIVLCGVAGQGIQTVESLLTKTLKRSGFNVFATREYMSRVRGGVNSTSIRISTKLVRAYIDQIDLLIPLNKMAIPHIKERITSQTIILGEREFINSEPNINGIKVNIPFQEVAEEIGGKILANIVSLGVLCGILDAEKFVLEKGLIETFKSKGQTIVEKNIRAANKGFEIADNLISTKKLKRTFKISKDSKVFNDYLIHILKSKYIIRSAIIIV